jgi:hypothetical protein
MNTIAKRVKGIGLALVLTIDLIMMPILMIEISISK